MTLALHTLPNGLRSACYTLPGVETVAVAISVDTGARHEEGPENGISHVLEHMAFKGTRRRSAKQIAEAFDDIGGVFNAYTSHENTVYYAKVLKQDVGVAMDILSDILLESVFDADELTREQQVILQEIAMQQDTPDDLVFDYFQDAAFKSQALGRSILGTPETVQSFTRDGIAGFMKRHYTPKRMALSAAGNIDPDVFFPMAELYFAPLAGETSIMAEAGNYTGGTVNMSQDLEQAHLVIGIAGVSVHDARHLSARLLAMILGGGMSSRLFQEVREKRGLAYSVSAFATAFSDTGIIGMYAATSEAQVAELVPVMCEQLVGMTRDISAQELQRAKNQFTASMLMSREKPSSVAEWIGRHLLTYGCVIPTEEMMQKVEAVSLWDIQTLCAELLKAPPTIAAVGPTGGLPDTQMIGAYLAA